MTKDLKTPLSLPALQGLVPAPHAHPPAGQPAQWPGRSHEQGLRVHWQAYTTNTNTHTSGQDDKTTSLTASRKKCSRVFQVGLLDSICKQRD